MGATYEGILAVIKSTHREETIRETGNFQGPIIIVKDNAEIWFYFDNEKNLKSVRAY
jgi:hypothetical protein